MSAVNFPDYWKIMKLGQVSDFQGGTQPPRSTFVFAPTQNYVRLLQIRDFETEDHVTYVSTKYNLRYVEADDILIARYGASVGKIFRGKKGAINVALMKTFPNEKLVFKPFLFYFLQTGMVQTYLKNLGGRSAQAGFNKAELGRIDFPLPPLPEQRAIAHVLQTIQEAKSTRQREFALERERKAALMDYLFSYGTKGEPRKETEIGEIPESWEVVRLEKLCACLDSKRVPVKQSERNERKGNIPYYGASGQTGWIDDYLFDAPLLLVAEDGENLVSRKLPIAYSIEGKSWVNNHAHVLRITDINQFFLEYYFNSIDLSPYLSGTTRPKLNKASLLGIPISRPSRVETDEIALVLSSCDTKIKALEQEAAQLDELFHAMLAELMTGKRSAVPLIDAELPK